MFTITAENRDTTIRPDKIRKEGKVPAVFYGKKAVSTPIAVSQKEFIKVWKEAGESSVVTLKRQDGDVEALIKEVTFDPVTGNAIHADFYVFEEGAALEVRVPIEFEGESPAVKNEGAILVKVLHELDISAQPKDLPHEILVDISSLVKLEDQLTASDIKLPSGVTLLQNPEDVIALVTMPKEEPVEETPMSIEDIEVETKGKKEEEEGAEPVAE